MRFKPLLDRADDLVPLRVYLVLGVKEAPAQARTLLPEGFVLPLAGDLSSRLTTKDLAFLSCLILASSSVSLDGLAEPHLVGKQHPLRQRRLESHQAAAMPVGSLVDRKAEHYLDS